MSNIDKQALLMSMQRVSEISKGSTLIVGEKERLANTAIYLADELKTATAAFQAAGFAQLDAEEKLEAANAKALKLLDELEVVSELFLRAKALMYQSGGTPIENSLNPIDAWLYDVERAAAAGKGE